MAQRIRRRRLERNLSIAEAARKLGVDRGTWHRWEADVYSMTAEMVPEVARVLDTTVTEIYGAP